MTMSGNTARRVSGVLSALALIATLGSLASSGPASAATLNVTGTWKSNYHCSSGPCPGGNTDFPDTITLTQAQGASTVTGSDPSGETISGTLTGNVLALTVTTSGGYVAHLSLTISADGQSWSGPGSDNNGTSGTDTANRLLNSAIQVNCDDVNIGLPDEHFQCTAQVGDSSGNAVAQTPTGTVTFAINPGGGGALQGPGTCTLMPSQTGGASSFCSVSYVAPAGGIPIGSQPPLTAKYSGDANFAPATGVPQNPILTSSSSTSTSASTTSTTETTSQTTTATTTSTTEATTTPSLASCPVPSAPVDNVNAPAPPTTNAALAHQAETPAPVVFPIPPNFVNPYCPNRTKYSANEKHAAALWADYYSQLSAVYGRDEVVFGAVGVAGLFSPDPTVTKAVGAAAGIAVAVNQLWSTNAASQASTMGVVAADPPDPNWRTIAAPLRTWPSRLPKAVGLKRKQQAALHAYLAAMLQGAANDWCVTNAINRGSTALENASRSVAAAQYRAGAACAATNVRLSKALPRLTNAARPALKTAERAMSNAALKRLFKAVERNASTRRRGAAHSIATLRSLIALPAAALSQMQTSLTQSAPSPPTKASLFQALTPQSAAGSTWGVLQEQSLQVLQQAANS